MILYLDASGLIKLYVAEQGSGPVRQAVKDAAATYAVDASYLAVRTALVEGARMGLLTEKAAKRARDDFETDWQAIHVVVPDQALLRLAGDIAETHAVAASVALNVASMQKIREQIGACAIRFIGYHRTQALATKLMLVEKSGPPTTSTTRSLRA